MHRIIGCLLVLACAQPAVAANLSHQVKQCAKVKNHLERLACFDQVATDLKSGIQPTASHTAVTRETVTTPAPTNQPQAATRVSSDDFGFENKVIKTPDSINVQIASQKKDRRGRWSLTLNNGQVWKQTESKSFRIDPSLPSYIRKGVLGSFFFAQEGRNSRIRVKRIK